MGGQLRQDRGKICHPPHALQYCPMACVSTALRYRNDSCSRSLLTVLLTQEARVAVLQQQADELDHVMDTLQRAAGESFDISKVTALLIETASALPFSCMLV